MKRIMIVGKSGSGKTYFADKLSQSTGIKAIHLDKLYYNPDWSHAYTKDEFTTLVSEIINGDKWIIDGNYSRTMDERVRRADVIIFFNTSLLKSFYYVIIRALFPKNNVPDKHEGMKEKISWTLFKQMATYPTSMIMEKISQNPNAELYIVRNHNEANTLLSRLG